MKNNNFKKTVLALAVSQIFITDMSSAAIISVTDQFDAEQGCTLREALTIFNSGRLPDLSNGCIVSGTLGENDQLEFINNLNSISLTQGEVLINSNVTVNQNGSNVEISGDGSRVLNVESATIALNNLTISNGSAVRGAGIYIKDSSVIIDNSIVDNNLANRYGGGISVYSSNVTINNSMVSNNRAFRTGGGVHVSENSILTINNSDISNNSASFLRGGGGLYIGSIYDDVASKLYVNNSTISGNRADIGGGISTFNDAYLSIDNSQIIDNYANDRSGGGISVYQSSAKITNSTITANSARSSAGGINADTSDVFIEKSTISDNTAIRSGAGGIGIGSSYAPNDKGLTIVNSTISGNSCVSGGGGISAFNSPVIVINSTISKNRSNVVGGGIDINQATINIANSIVSGNFIQDNLPEGSEYGVPPRGSELYSFSPSLSILTTEGSNLFGDSSLASEQAFFNLIPNINTNLVATSDGNIPTSLSNILAPLASNGGETQTHGLVVNSPAIDAGNNSICLSNPVNSVDQRGFDRPVSATCDLGAFEGEVQLEVEGISLFTIPLPNGKTVVFGL